jgi:homoserine dehydrogenase
VQRLKLILPKFGSRAEAHRDAASTPPLKIFKFGSSVLRTPADLPRVAGEIYRECRHGERIIAVVSALEGETDALIEACSIASGETDCAGIAEAVSLGEEKAAALLRIACDRVGLDAEVVCPEDFGILTSGDLAEADPVALHGHAGALFARSNVLIVPGFVGVDRSGRRSLLGRGGTDFTAIFLGGELEADLVRLYKDVDGVFDHDPADTEKPLLRFADVSWSDCLTLARPLLQPRAVEYALAKGRKLEVGVIGTRSPTRIASATVPPRAHASPPRLRIALAGYGTVGQALAERLALESNFQIAAVLVRNPSKVRRVPPPVALTADAAAFMETDADVLIDLTSCEATGLKLSLESLKRGIPVISANKLVIGKHLEGLDPLTGPYGAKLLYSAAVGGSSPVIEAVRRAFSHGEVARIDALLNGTVNFLLDRIAGGAAYDEALKRAQAAGFAEEDPSQDLAGRDAELKLRILAAEILGPDHPVEIHVEALDLHRLAEIALSGERWIQHSSLTFGGDDVKGSVRIRRAGEVPNVEAPRGERNFAAVTCADSRRFTAVGRGAGGAATAEAVTADLYDIWADVGAARGNGEAQGSDCVARARA